MRHQYLVIGLGRFGNSVATKLVDLGQEVLGLDMDEHVVEGLKGNLTHVVQGDATDPDTLRAVDIEQFDGAVVAIGDNFEASVLTTLLLKQLDVPYVMAKAMSAEQVRVLQLLGADRVVYPEADAGAVAALQLVNRHLLDFLQLDAQTIMAALRVGSWAGGSLRKLERQCGLEALGVYRNGKVQTVGRDEPLGPDDTVLLAGSSVALQTLGQLQ